MFEKIGVTLADSGLYDVTIIGYPSHQAPQHPAIQFIPLPSFVRFSMKRLLISWTVFKKINQVKPELLIINTPELLLVALLSRILYRRKIIYDVLENYYLNIRYTPAFSSWVRPLLAALVRLVEIAASPLVHYFFLAEKGYKNELNFANPCLVLQNKLPRSVSSQVVRSPQQGYSKLLFSGTLATSTGVFEAIQICKNLHKLDASFSLTIIGYCALPEEHALLKKEIASTSFISLIGGDALVPHHRVLEEIGKADIGMIIYPPNPSTRCSIPTKLFEYLALQLPVVIRHNPESHQLVEEFKAGIILPDVPDYNSIAAELKTNRIASTIHDSLFWESEKFKIIDRLKLL